MKQARVELAGARRGHEGGPRNLPRPPSRWPSRLRLQVQLHLMLIMKGANEENTREQEGRTLAAQEAQGPVSHEVAPLREVYQTWDMIAVSHAKMQTPGAMPNPAAPKPKLPKDLRTRADRSRRSSKRPRPGRIPYAAPPRGPEGATSTGSATTGAGLGLPAGGGKGGPGQTAIDLVAGHRGPRGMLVLPGLPGPPCGVQASPRTVVRPRSRTTSSGVVSMTSSLEAVVPNRVSAPRRRGVHVLRRLETWSPRRTGMPSRGRPRDATGEVGARPGDRLPVLRRGDGRIARRHQSSRAPPARGRRRWRKHSPRASCARTRARGSCSSPWSARRTVVYAKLLTQESGVDYRTLPLGAVDGRRPEGGGRGGRAAARRESSPALRVVAYLGDTRGGPGHADEDARVRRGVPAADRAQEGPHRRRQPPEGRRDEAPSSAGWTRTRPQFQGADRPRGRPVTPGHRAQASSA